MTQRRQATRRFLATVLFTDIVGSTSRAAELGDRGWRDLVERHHAVVRRELKAYGGREMDTAGDGFFAVFETPERAVRCAASVISGVAPLGLQVRAGVHTGECEVIDGKVGGMTVTIGARIAALADAGQVLVSRSVRDLMTGSGRAFEGGEQQTLKGVADQWRVYRLVPDDLDADAPRSRRPSMVPLYTGRQRRRLIVSLAGVLVVALAVSGGYLLTRSRSSLAVGENDVGVIGPGGTPRVSAAIGVGQRPTAVAAGFDAVWVTNSAEDSVSRIDLHTKSAAPIHVGASPAGVSVGARAVWVANSGDATVSRIDPKTSQPTVIPVRPGPTGILVAYGKVWVTNALDASVTEIDPDTNKVVPPAIPVGANPTGIAAGAGSLWVTNQGDGTVTRIDPKTHETDAAIKVGSGPVGIAYAAGAVWVANNLEGSLSRIDVDDLAVTSRLLRKDGGAYGVAAHRGDIWVSNEYAGTLMRVTAARDFRLRTKVPIGGAPLGLAFVGDDLWFTSAGGGSALHRGGVLTMVGPGVVFPGGDDLAALDPTIQYDPASWRLAGLTNDGLVGFRRAAGVQGAVLVADLATSVPKSPTNGGLTYTFHLQKGVRYSTGEPVLAGDIRRGLERTAMHDTGPGFSYTPVILGGQACHDAAIAAVAAKKPLPDCDLSKGVIANDKTGTITFHLARPDPEFLYQLALPSAVAVPQDTLIDLAPGSFLPATGPYQISAYTPKQDAEGGHGRLELVRNPHFRVWSPAAQPGGYPDRIVLETGYTNEQAVARVSDGRDDMLWFGAPQSDVDRLRTRYGAQLHQTAGQFVRYVFLNVTKPPFDNVQARRAVAFALDRQSLADLFSGPVTCQLVAPDFPGYRPYCPFTAGDRAAGKWGAPDRAAAQDLVRRSGTRGDKVRVAVFRDAIQQAAGHRLVRMLNGLGYDASLRVHKFGDFDALVAKPSNNYNAGLTFWGADYPAASNYVAVLASCTGSYNLTGYCNRALDRQMSPAFVQQVTDPAGAGDAWAAIDRAAVDAAAVIPFSAELNQDFVSRRVGHVLVRPGGGPIIAQLWVQ